ncbi:hypothetical protein BDP27DRAFT_814055 [Rhodocollybia butyracea]|uniref:Uncharacterized protein n=1 Tax=Rhodocollybia butyracea TaxID=206335 RepID=A0A9P5PR04_9AGAR|nr:hypothetical protein BDP27DRAFT_814055 [Rhodocollybia butyracea]
MLTSSASSNSPLSRLIRPQFEHLFQRAARRGSNEYDPENTFDNNLTATASARTQIPQNRNWNSSIVFSTRSASRRKRNRNWVHALNIRPFPSLLSSFPLHLATTFRICTPVSRLRVCFTRCNHLLAALTYSSPASSSTREAMPDVTLFFTFYYFYQTNSVVQTRPSLNLGWWKFRACV